MTWSGIIEIIKNSSDTIMIATHHMIPSKGHTNILLSNMYMIAIQLFVFIPILGNQPGALLKWNCCRSLKPSRSAQCRHWWYLGPSKFYFWLVTAMNEPRYTPESTNMEPSNIGCFFSCFSKCFSLSSFGGINFRFNDFTIDKELHHFRFSLEVVDSLFRNANVKLRRQCPGFVW